MSVWKRGIFAALLCFEFTREGDTRDRRESLNNEILTTEVNV